MYRIYIKYVIDGQTKEFIDESASSIMMNHIVGLVTNHDVLVLDIRKK